MKEVKKIISTVSKSIPYSNLQDHKIRSLDKIDKRILIRDKIDENIFLRNCGRLPFNRITSMPLTRSMQLCTKKMIEIGNQIRSNIQSRKPRSS